MPEWAVNQPDLCGVGIYKFRGSTGPARKFSIAQGRIDLGSQIETKVKSMIKSYTASGELDSKDFSEELSRLAAVNLSKSTINGSVPVKFAKIDENIFTLVCLKPGVFTDAINNMRLLSNAQRNALKRRAAVAQQELKEQMKSYDN